jgi:hypothetical protein
MSGFFYGIAHFICLPELVRLKLLIKLLSYIARAREKERLEISLFVSNYGIYALNLELVCGCNQDKLMKWSNLH